MNKDDILNVVKNLLEDIKKNLLRAILKECYKIEKCLRYDADWKTIENVY